MNVDLRNAQQRARQYWFIDGLAELAAGLMGIVLAALFWFSNAILLSRWGVPGLFVGAALLAIAFRIAIQKVKERSTYRSTGYVAPLSGLENKRVIGIAAVFVLLLLVAQFVLNRQGNFALLWSPAIGGLIFAFIFGLAAYETGLPRLYYLAVFCGVIGIILGLTRSGFILGMSLLCGLVGIWLLISGALVRRDYLEKNLSSGENG